MKITGRKIQDLNTVADYPSFTKDALYPPANTPYSIHLQVGPTVLFYPRKTLIVKSQKARKQNEVLHRLPPHPRSRRRCPPSGDPVFPDPVLSTHRRRCQQCHPSDFQFGGCACWYPSTGASFE